MINILKQMTTQEKIQFLSAKDTWHTKDMEKFGIPSIMLTDGPHGIRKQDGQTDHLGINESTKSTCFPTASALACSFDRELLYKLGEHLGQECLTEKISILLGPGINIKRSPLCGRNFEYFSEDPVISGELAASFINGVQSKGIGTSLKHFAVNNQESRRMVTDSVVDIRALHEIYLKAFEIAVKKSNPWTVMTAYNMVNGEYCSDNKYLLTDILREQWGYKGVTLTDWGATNDRVESLKAGLDLETPGSAGAFDKQIAKAIKSGKLTIEDIDKAVLRNLELIEKTKNTFSKNHNFDKDIHHEFARKIASECTVLLKNENGVLPLSKKAKIAVIGDFAKVPRYQGAGSSKVNPTQISSIIDELEKQNIAFKFAKGYDKNLEVEKQDLIDEAVLLASDCDCIVAVVGLTESKESEGFDRESLDLPDAHNNLIFELCKLNKNIVIVLQNGAPILMPWLNKVNGVIETYLSGQAGGAATVDVLFGDINPSGKLAETFPLSLNDDLVNINYPDGPKTVEYKESVFLGYRYYNTVKKAVLFPFGFGLSYTEFEYSNLIVNGNIENDDVKISFKIKNTGKVSGKEIAQIYVKSKSDNYFHPEMELKNFTKISLLPNEIKEVTLNLQKSDFAHFNATKGEYHIENGEYEILLASSSRDIKSSVSLNYTKSNNNSLSEGLEKTVYFNMNKDVKDVPLEEFEKLIGGKVPVKQFEKNEPFTLVSTVSEVKNTLAGGFLYNTMKSQMVKEFARLAGGAGKLKEEDFNMIEHVIAGMPLRSLVIFSNGMFTFPLMKILIKLMNLSKNKERK